MVVHQDYLAHETALFHRRAECDAAAQDAVRRRVLALAARLAPGEPDAAGTVLAALGLVASPVPLPAPAGQTGRSLTGR